MKKYLSVKALCLMLAAVIIVSAPVMPGYQPGYDDCPAVIMPFYEYPCPKGGGKP